MRTRPNLTHRFDVDPQEAQAIQQQLRELLSDRPPSTVDRVAGVYALFAERTEGPIEVAAAACVMGYPGLVLLEETAAGPRPAEPYRPALFAFSVGPAMVEALECLRTEPDVVLVPAHGTAHPRGLGLAAHLGVLLDVPTIGCADERLAHELTPAAEVEVRPGARPLFVSPGHRMDLPTAVRIVRACCPRYRTPEPIRRARALLRQRRALGSRA
jgi:deoxyribonuclease V